MVQISKIPYLAEEQRQLIIDKYPELGFLQTKLEFNKKYEHSDYVVKTISIPTILQVLEKAGVEIHKQGYCFRPKKILNKSVFGGKRTSYKEITPDVKKDVVKDFKQLKKGILAFKEIRKNVLDNHKKHLSFDQYENILKEAGFDLSSDEYRNCKQIPNP